MPTAFNVTYNPTFRDRCLRASLEQSVVSLITDTQHSCSTAFVRGVGFVLARLDDDPGRIAPGVRRPGKLLERPVPRFDVWAIQTAADSQGVVPAGGAPLSNCAATATRARAHPDAGDIAVRTVVVHVVLDIHRVARGIRLTKRRLNSLLIAPGVLEILHLQIIGCGRRVDLGSALPAGGEFQTIINDRAGSAGIRTGLGCRHRDQRQADRGQEDRSEKRAGRWSTI